MTDKKKKDNEMEETTEALVKSGIGLGVGARVVEDIQPAGFDAGGGLRGFSSMLPVAGTVAGGKAVINTLGDSLKMKKGKKEKQSELLK